MTLPLKGCYIFSMEQQGDSLRHHCGVVGVHSANPDNIPEKLFYGLFALQHRGQESAGICYRKEIPEDGTGRFVTYKDLGMVSTVLSRYLEKPHPSTLGIGHVRYSTRGGNRLENAQPLAASCNKGSAAIAHNGNISNASALNARLSMDGSIFQSTSDTELILHMIARSRQPDFKSALIETLGELEGAFSMVMLHEDQLIAIRDPWGFRPLYIGFSDTITAVASETCALDMLKIRDFREVKPGEILYIDSSGVKSETFAPGTEPKRCVFELIYFARPDSLVFEESVHLTRKAMGAALAMDESAEADLVMPVPDSGNSAALGYAEQSGLPFEQGLTRNHYAGRSFILPTTSQRELAVRMKLHPVREVVRGKRIILVDDSLVRGTTSRILISLMREAGAKEVHLRLSAPEIKFPCYYGIDIPTRKELISNSLSPDGIAAHIGANSVKFLKIPRLMECLKDGEGYCYACFTGNYPVQPREV